MSLHWLEIPRTHSFSLLLCLKYLRTYSYWLHRVAWDLRKNVWQLYLHAAANVNDQTQVRQLFHMMSSALGRARFFYGFLLISLIHIASTCFTNAYSPTPYANPLKCLKHFAVLVVRARVWLMATSLSRKAYLVLTEFVLSIVILSLVFCARNINHVPVELPHTKTLAQEWCTLCRYG